jgi:hypothetical protein
LILRLITFTEFFAEKTISGATIAQHIKIQDATPNPDPKSTNPRRPRTQEPAASELIKQLCNGLENGNLDGKRWNDRKIELPVASSS